VIDYRHWIINRIPKSSIIRRVVDKQFKTVIRNSGWLLVGDVGSGILGLAQTILLGRILGAEQFGLLALIIAYVSIVNQFVDFRVWEMATKYLSDFWVKEDRERTLATVKLSYLIDLLSGIVAFLVVILGLPLVSRFVFSEPVAGELVVLFAFSLLFATVNGTGQAILRVFDKFQWLAAWRVAVSTVKLVLVTSALLAGFGLGGVLIAYSASALAGGLGLLYLSIKVVKALVGVRRASVSLLKGRYKEIALFLMHTNMGTFWGAIIRNLDVMLLGYFWGTTEVGYFKMAKTFVSQLAMITNPLYDSLFPELTKMWAAGDISAYNRFIRKLTIVSGTLIIVAALVFSVVAPWIVNLTVGEDFLPAVAAIRVMVWGIVIAVTFVWARPTVIAIGKPQIGNLAGGIGVVLYVAISLIIVPLWSYLGTATMFLLPYVVGHIIVAGGYFLHLRDCGKAHQSSIDGQRLV